MTIAFKWVLQSCRSKGKNCRWSVKDRARTHPEPRVLIVQTLDDSFCYLFNNAASSQWKKRSSLSLFLSWFLMQLEPPPWMLPKTGHHLVAERHPWLCDAESLALPFLSCCRRRRKELCSCWRRFIRGSKPRPTCSSRARKGLRRQSQLCGTSLNALCYVLGEGTSLALADL